MGILTTLGIIAAASAVTKSASNERKAEERRQEIEKEKRIAEQQEITRRTLAIEEEKTRRTLAMQEAARQRQLAQQEAARQRQFAEQAAADRRQRELADIRQKRLDYPINYTCPRCTALRTVDRHSGKITCPYCDYVQPLESFHNFVPELDTTPAQKIGQPSQTQQQQHNNNPISTKKGAFNIWALLSLIFGVISFFTCGILIVPEILGIVFGIIPFCQGKEKRNGWAFVFSAIGFMLCGISMLFLLISFIGASTDSSTASSAIETTTSVMKALISIP